MLFGTGEAGNSSERLSDPYPTDKGADLSFGAGAVDAANTANAVNGANGAAEARAVLHSNPEVQRLLGDLALLQEGNDATVRAMASQHWDQDNVA